MESGIEVGEAWARLEAALRPLGVEEVPLEQACGRVLSRPVHADRDAPAFDRAAMDGFAVLAADVGRAGRRAPVRLRVVGESVPGSEWRGTPEPGAAVRIMTGAALPSGWDAVVPVEETSGFGAAEVEVYAAAEPGQNVTRRAAERRAGDLAVACGRRLGPADIGALAMLGASCVPVGRQPRVAVLATGNEIVPHAATPGPLEIRNSNGPMLAALAAAHSREVVVLGAARDERAVLESLLRRGLECDVLLVSGGVSMGAYDLVGESLLRLGVRLHFRRVALQPGKPVAFGTHAGGAVLALPGNPVSAFTTFRLLAQGALRLLEGEATARPRWGGARAEFDWQRRNPKLLLWPGRRSADGGAVQRVAYAGSGDLLAYARADCQIVLPPEVQSVRVGELVPIWPL